MADWPLHNVDVLCLSRAVVDEFPVSQEGLNHVLEGNIDIGIMAPIIMIFIVPPDVP